MSSRNPAPDGFPDTRMPDLPADLFADSDEVYAPSPQRSPRRRPRDRVDPRRSGTQRRGRSTRTEHYQGIDEVTEQRPKRHPRPLGSNDHRRRTRETVHTVWSSETRAVAEATRVAPASENHQGRVPARPLRGSVPANRPPGQERRPLTPTRQDRVIEQPRMRAEGATVDLVTSVRPARSERAARRRYRNPAWAWTPIVVPQARQVLAQALPNLLMALIAAAILAVMPYIPFGLPLWAPLLMAPMLALFYFADEKVHPMWARAAIINLATVGAFFPSVIMRQSVLRVPFVEWGNGTLPMPIMATVGVVVLLGVLAAGSAVLCEEDPEYAGVIFVPAALMVPFFAGATEITSLDTAFVVMAGIYVASAALTVIASVLPGAYPTLVAPIALAIEFLVLPLAKNTPIFPVGAGTSAKLLFFIVLSVAVGLTVAVPVMAVWFRQVWRLVIAGDAGARRLAAAH